MILGPQRERERERERESCIRKHGVRACVRACVREALERGMRGVGGS